MGRKGAALGNLVAEWAAATAGFAWVLVLLRPTRAAAVARRRAFWRPQTFREQASINGYLLTRTLFIQLAFAILSVSGARLGDDVLAANHVLLQLVFIASLGLVGMSSATQALFGEAKGGGDLSMFHFWARRTAVWSFLVSLAYAVVYGASGSEIIAAFTDVESVRAAASPQILLVALWPVLAVWSYQLDGIFIGATGARQMMWCAAAATLVFIVVQWLLVPSLGNLGLWIAFILFFMVRALSLAACYPSLGCLLSQPRPPSTPTVRLIGAVRAPPTLASSGWTRPAFDFCRGPEVEPGPEARSNAEIDAFVRAAANSAYHPCGSCSMGEADLSMVDPQTRVRGVEGPRVADASIMPSTTSGTINAPSMMIGEKRRI